MNFQFSEGIPKLYWRNRSLLSNFVNALHVLFPPGEKYFARMISRALKEMDDPELKRMAKNFSAQEMQHALEHTKVGEFLRRHGYDTSRFEKVLKGMIAFAEEKISLKANMAFIAGIEHFTALIGNIVLSDESILQDMHPEFKELMRWHAAEEIEHKAAAFDVSQGLDSSYLLRASMMVLAALFVYGFIGAIMVDFTRQDKKLFSLETLDGFIYLFLGEHMLFPRTFAEFIKYFRPGFHPNDVEDYHLAERVFGGLKAAG